MDIRPAGNTTHAPPTPADKAVKTAPPAAAAKKAAVDAVQEAAQVQQAKPAPSEEQVAQALKSINNVLQLRSPDLEFSVDSESERTIVKVVDKKTQEVIRQMPSQEALDIAKALDKLQSLLIRDTA
ncbi:MAG: flagellar protein FlaG [Telluria sp.]|nr:flagellar protein FlaG [Telluria sp.]